MTTLRPGYLRWDGTKYVLDTDVEIVGPQGAAGAPGTPGTPGAAGPAGASGTDLLLTGNNSNVIVPDTQNYIVKFKGLTSPATLTLPASPGTGQRVIVSDSDGSCTSTNTITVIATGGHNITSVLQTQFVLTDYYETHTFEWNGDLWVHINSYLLRLPQRGLTLSLRANKSTFISGGAVNQWYDLAKVGQFFSATSTGATFNASGFNNRETLDFIQGTEMPYINPEPSQATFAHYITPTDFTFATAIQYTGSNNNTASPITTPVIIATTNMTTFTDVPGLGVGLDPGNSANIIFTLYTSASPLRAVQSASVAKNVPHYVVGTFTGGTISLYVDALTPVTLGSVPAVTATELNISVELGASNESTSQELGAHLRSIHIWNVALDADEIAQAQAWLRTDSGL